MSHFQDLQGLEKIITKGRYQEYKSIDKFKPGALYYGMIPAHLLLIPGLVLVPFSWDLILLAFVILFILSLGNPLTYHRGLAHQSFQFSNKLIERIFVTLGALSFQRGPIWWVSIHRLHHKYSDTENDPHSGKKGFWFSNVLWLFYLDPRWHYPKNIEQYEKFAKDIASDPYYRWLDRNFYIPGYVLLLILFLIGGLPWVVYGWMLSLVFKFQVTFLVNSVCHRFGYRNFETGDNSTNNRMLFIAMGENYHHNHHAFPFSARTGFIERWELDLFYVVLVIFKKMGLVKSFQLPSQAQVDAALIKRRNIPTKAIPSH